jgi:hypothetical protein
MTHARAQRDVCRGNPQQHLSRSTHILAAATRSPHSLGRVAICRACTRAAPLVAPPPPTASDHAGRHGTKLRDDRGLLEPRHVHRFGGALQRLAVPAHLTGAGATLSVGRGGAVSCVPTEDERGSQRSTNALERRPHTQARVHTRNSETERNSETANLRVRVEIMGSQKCRHVGKSQSFLVRIDPVIFTHTRTSASSSVSCATKPTPAWRRTAPRRLPCTPTTHAALMMRRARHVPATAPQSDSRLAQPPRSPSPR